MLFNLAHAFLIFSCVVLIVRLTMPERYVLLNPYAAMLDNLLTKLFHKIYPAIPLPHRVLCALLIVLFLCADAVMCSRLHINADAIGVTVAFQLPSDTFLDWLRIAALLLARQFVLLWSAVFFLQLWHRSRRLPGYSGDLLCLSVHPVLRLPLSVQIVGLCIAAFLLNWAYFMSAISVAYPIEVSLEEQLAALPRGVSLTVSQMTMPLQMIAFAGLRILDVLREIYGFSIMLVFVWLISTFMRSKDIANFLADVFHLLRGRLPVIILGSFNLTPILVAITFFVLSGFVPLIFLFILNLIALLGGWHVV